LATNQGVGRSNRSGRTSFNKKGLEKSRPFFIFGYPSGVRFISLNRAQALQKMKQGLHVYPQAVTSKSISFTPTADLNITTTRPKACN
jgi:hypothetical protein